MQANGERTAPLTAPPSGGGARLGPAGYPSDLERDVAGAVADQAGIPRYHVRPIRPDDTSALAAFHRALSPHSVYLRFFSFHPELSEAEVERFTTVDYRDRLALVVTFEGTLVAVGRFDREPGTTEAEVAFVVADEHQQHGLGSLLLDELARAGRQRGVTAFRAETLAENTGMLDVFRHSGYPLTSHVEWGTVSLRFPIAMTEEAGRALHAREASRRVPTVRQS